MCSIRIMICTFLLFGISISGCGNDTQQPKRLILAEIDTDGDNIVDKTVHYIYGDSTIEGSGDDTVIFIESDVAYGCSEDMSESFFIDFNAYVEICFEDIDEDESNLNSDDWTMPVYHEYDFGHSLPYQYIYTPSESYVVEYEDLSFDSLSYDDQLAILSFTNLTGSGTDVPQNVDFNYRHDNDGYVIEFEHIKQYEGGTDQKLNVHFTWE